jgi:hypothetical protein
MPIVGTQKFPYNAKGKKAAKAAAKKTGKPMHEADGLKAYLQKKHGK